MTSTQFQGRLDGSHQRSGAGLQTFVTRDGKETYFGNFKNDTYNGTGNYKNNGIFTEKWVYEGAWFGNRKHGYGLLSFADNTFFQGLYNEDTPCGPGVFTECDQKQNVGFWKGSSIIRLIVNVDSGVPRLSTTPERTPIALKYRRLVPVGPSKDDVTKIAQSNGLNEKQLLKLYSKHCKNCSSHFFNWSDFDDNYFNDLKTVNSLLPQLSEQDFLGEGSQDELTDGSEGTNVDLSGRPSSVKEEERAWFRLRNNINYLLAWNNTQAIIDLMSHSFKNRFYQDLAGFNVDQLLCCQRRSFKQPGEHETVCMQVLQSSEKGDVEEMSRLFYFYNLNVNLTDSKGNGCLIRASALDHLSVIALMPVYEADLNLTNDEGFTSLNLALTRYLAGVLDVTDWGAVFLPPAKILADHIRKWANCENFKPTDWSTSNFTRYIDESTKKKVKISPRKKKVAIKEHEKFETYLFDLKPQFVEIEHSFFTAIRSLKSLRQDFNKDAVISTELGKFLQEDFPEVTRKIRKTIDLLLEIGADVNACQVPAPALILAFFTDNLALMRDLLTRGADPNSRLSVEDGSLTCLHIIALAKPKAIFFEIIDLLLEFGANPNAQAAIGFDPESVQFVLNNYPLDMFPSEGLTPIQALCFRVDGHTVDKRELLLEILNRILNVSTASTFLGHTILSLAAIRLNADFVLNLLKLPQINPNERFNSVWGNLAACYTQYLGFSKSPLALIILIELERAGLNPLRRVHKSVNKNALNFALKTLQKEDKSAAENLAQWQTSGSIGPKPFCRPRKEMRKKLYILQEIARDKVDRHIKGVVIRNLVTFIREMEKQKLPIVDFGTDNDVVQGKNWLYVDEFTEYAIRNAKAGLLYLKQDELEVIFEIIYKEKETFPCTSDPEVLQKAEAKEIRRLIWELLDERRKDLMRLGRERSGMSLTKRLAILSPKKAVQLPAKKRYRSKSIRSHKKLPRPVLINPQEEITDDAEVKQAKKKEFLEKFKDIVATSMAHFKWLDKTGSYLAKKFKKEKFNFDLYPEVHTKNKLYEVCYECLGRFSALELCPSCKLVWFCSTPCNINDLTNRNSNHKCLILFYGLGSKWHLLKYDEHGSLILVPRFDDEEEERESEEDEAATDDVVVAKSTRSFCGSGKSVLVPCTEARPREETPSISISIICQKRKKHKKRKHSFNVNDMMKMYKLKGKMTNDIRTKDYLLWGHLPFNQNAQPENLLFHSNDKEFNKQSATLQALASRTGRDFDVNAYFPWMVYRDGQLYYKILPTQFAIENYSLV